MSTWLVTGTSRGIGLELVRQILASNLDDIVFATARAPKSSPGLQQLHADPVNASRMHLVDLDVANEQSVKEAAKAVEGILQGRGLDYIVNNAGRGAGGDNATNFDPQVMLSVLQTNVIGAALVFKAFLPALERSTRPEGPVVMNTSSGLGSIQSNTDATRLSYCLSKSALNMLTVKQAKQKSNVIVFAMRPGWVKTDMGGKNATLEPSVSVRHQYRSITNATRADTGTLKQFDGEYVPW